MPTSPNPSSLNNDKPDAPDTQSAQAPQTHGRGAAFWFILLAICVTLFLSALEQTAVSTALPTIVNELHGNDFVWVGSAYALAATAILPMTGGLAQIFGRRPSTLGAILIFGMGSALCGAATSMAMLIAGRTVQGLGGGGILSLSSIVLADLVSLRERGTFGALFGLTWSLASAIGPVVGGSLSSEGQWRWLFYLNLPLCGLSMILVVVFMKLPSPQGTLKQKLSRMDWIGNIIVIGSSCATAISLTWGGVTAPWGSVQILVPLVVGLIGLAAFIIYEAKWARYPMVPFSLMSNRTSLSGYLMTFFLPIVSLALVYYIPVYFQACKDATAVSSGVRTLSLASLAPSALIASLLVRKMNRYRPQIWLGWVLTIVGLGLLTTVDANTSSATAIGFIVLTGIGLGCNYSTNLFPVQAPLPVSSNAHALAFFSFIRSFAAVWGVTIGGAILQNQLKRRLPLSFTASFPEGVAIAYAAIPQIRDLQQPLKGEVRDAFGESLKVVWKVMAGVAAAGILSSALMKGLSLHTEKDEQWALQEEVDRQKSGVA